MRYNSCLKESQFFELQAQLSAFFQGTEFFIGRISKRKGMVCQSCLFTDFFKNASNEAVTSKKSTHNI